MLVCLSVGPTLFSRQVYAGKKDRRYSENGTSSSDGSALILLDLVSSMKGNVKRVTYGLMPVSEDVSSEFEDEIY